MLGIAAYRLSLILIHANCIHIAWPARTWDLQVISTTCGYMRCLLSNTTYSGHCKSTERYMADGSCIYIYILQFAKWASEMPRIYRFEKVHLMILCSIWNSISYIILLYYIQTLYAMLPNTKMPKQSLCMAHKCTHYSYSHHISLDHNSAKWQW